MEFQKQRFIRIVIPKEIEIFSICCRRDAQIGRLYDGRVPPHITNSQPLPVIPVVFPYLRVVNDIFNGFLIGKDFPGISYEAPCASAYRKPFEVVSP